MRILHLADLHAIGYCFGRGVVSASVIFMTHFSIAQLSGKSLPVEGWILKSTLPDIVSLPPTSVKPARSWSNAMSLRQLSTP